MNLEAMQGVILDVAAERDVDGILRDIVTGIANCPHVGLARIWLLRSEADDRGERSWLQLAASAGNLWASGANPTRLDGAFARMEVGDRKIGQVAATGRGILLNDLESNRAWIAEPEWARSEGLRSFAAQPLIARGEILGVLAVFDRKEIPPESFIWLRTFADHAAIALRNARAFAEIERLRRRLQLDNDYLREEVTRPFDEILGESQALRRVMQQVERVAATDANVLILGESGVGKELVARALHRASARGARPLVKVNCAAVPEALFESEFFGHVQGAFTGAVRDRLGRFEVADGGTLFLDEVGEIPLSQQAKLLRVLQEGTFERVGEESERRVDVRILAATNRDLLAESERGAFRTDLYYRLGVFPIEIPPLRDRPEDLPALARHAIRTAARRLGAEPPELTLAALRSLQAQAWPGNVRELQHVLERAVILARNGRIRPEDLPFHETARAPVVSEVAASDEAIPTWAEWKAREREVLRRALERAEGKISGAGGAAELLGLPPTTLESKLRSHGLKGPGGAEGPAR